jgi:putative alpha-1,2-mannosidase
VQKIKLNGKPFAGLLLNHEDIMKGGVLEFFMGAKPAVTPSKL